MMNVHVNSLHDLYTDHENNSSLKFSPCRFFSEMISLSVIKLKAVFKALLEVHLLAGNEMNISDVPNASLKACLDYVCLVCEHLWHSVFR